MRSCSSLPPRNRQAAIRIIPYYDEPVVGYFWFSIVCVSRFTTLKQLLVLLAVIFVGYHLLVVRIRHAKFSVLVSPLGYNSTSWTEQLSHLVTTGCWPLPTNLNDGLVSVDNHLADGRAERCPPSFSPTPSPPRRSSWMGAGAKNGLGSYNRLSICIMMSCWLTYDIIIICW